MSIQDNLCLFGKSEEGQGWKIVQCTSISIGAAELSELYTLCLCSGAIVLISDQSY